MDLIERTVIENWVRNNVRLSYSRSSGPGGQNVNKLNTKVTAWVAVGSMDFLSEEEKESAMSRLSPRLNRKGELVLRVQDTRSREQNTVLAVRRITDVIAEALKKRRKRRMTRPTLKSEEERLRSKKIKGERKRLRGTVFDDETGTHR